MRRTLDRLNPMGDAARMIERNRTRPADEIADAVLARDARLFTDDPGEIELRAYRMGLTYACEENPIYFDPKSEEDDWSQAMLNRDRSGELTGRWWFPLAVCGGIIALWLVLKGLGVK